MPNSAGRHRPPGYRAVRPNVPGPAPDHKRLLWTQRFRRFRAAFLADPDHALCADCRQAGGELTPAVDIHHARGLEAHPEDLCDGEHCLALCKRHHAIRTRRGE